MATSATSVPEPAKPLTASSSEPSQPFSAPHTTSTSDPSKPLSASRLHSTPSRLTFHRVEETFDLAIIGSGPAALTAALYAARAGLSVAVYERGNIGGALAEISQISNYPGFSGPGPDLAAALKSQATSAGAQIFYGECSNISIMHPDPVLEAPSYSRSSVSGATSDPSASPEPVRRPGAPDLFALTIDDGIIVSRYVLVATGSEPKPLDVATKTPISYCALCDGDLVKGKHVAVVGGGNSAFQEALYLAPLAADVTIISRSPARADACVKTRVSATLNLTLQENTPATPDLLDQFDHIFVYIGKRPATSFLSHLAASSSLLDPEGYIIINPSAHSTSVPNLYAAGDVRKGAVRQAITAAADGAAAAIEIADAFHTTPVLLGRLSKRH